MSENSAPHEEFWLKLTEREMAAIGNCLSAYFNLLAADKRAPSPEVCMHVASAMDKMKYSADNRVTSASALQPSIIITPSTGLT